MNVKEFGADRAETILLLHGGGLSWWNYREEARLLEDDRHVVLPVLDGHADSGTPFTTIADNAEALLSLIDERFGGSVLFIGGLSLGGQILLEMLARRRDVCRYALVESAAVIPTRLTGALIGPAVGCSYGLIRNERFARAQFKALHIREDLYGEYYRDTCKIAREDMTAFMKASTTYSLPKSLGETSARVHVCFGERETRVIRKSAEALCRAVPSAELHRLPGLYHGEFSLNRPGEYAALVREIVGGG